MKIEIELIDHTPDDATSNLDYGDGYVVLYLDRERNEKLAAAIWNGNDFFYPAMTRRLPPKLDAVLGYAKLKDWKRT